jgi:hypothetical protein
MALGACPECEMFSRREGLLVIDNQSEPGAWERELKKLPWGYGQKREPTIAEILYRMRAHGLDVEADIIAREIASLSR